MKPRLQMGLPEVDAFTGGFAAGELIVIGGRPAMGAQALALTMLVNMRHDFRACYISLDVSSAYIQQRIHDQFIPDPPDISLICAELEYVAILPEAAKDHHLVFRLAQPPLLRLQETIIRIHEVCAPDYFIIDQMDETGLRVPPLCSKSKAYRDVFSQFKVLARALNKPIILLAGMHSRMDRKKRLRKGMAYYASKERIPDVLLLPFRPFYYGLVEDENGDKIDSDHMALSMRRSGHVQEIGWVDLRMDYMRRRVESGVEV